MGSRLEVRRSIAVLLHAGKTPTEISRELSVGRKLVYVVKNLVACGEDLKIAPRHPKRPVMTPRIRANIKQRIKSAPTKSMRRVADEAGVNREIVRRVVQEEGWKSLRKVKVPLISAEGRRKREVRAQGLISSLKSAKPGQIIFFSDEKSFVVDPVFNPQNDRWI